MEAALKALYFEFSSAFDLWIVYSACRYSNKPHLIYPGINMAPFMVFHDHIWKSRASLIDDIYTIHSSPGIRYIYSYV